MCGGVRSLGALPGAVGWGDLGVQGSNVRAALSLSGNGIGPAGGVQLAESLALCKHLEELM